MKKLILFAALLSAPAMANPGGVPANTAAKTYPNSEACMFFKMNMMMPCRSQHDNR